jgi:hypothetical protein
LSLLARRRTWGRRLRRPLLAGLRRSLSRLLRRLRAGSRRRRRLHRALGLRRSGRGYLGRPFLRSGRRRRSSGPLLTRRRRWCGCGPLLVLRRRRGGMRRGWRRDLRRPGLLRRGWRRSLMGRLRRGCRRRRLRMRLRRRSRGSWALLRRGGSAGLRLALVLLFRSGLRQLDPSDLGACGRCGHANDQSGTCK